MSSSACSDIPVSVLAVPPGTGAGVGPLVQGRYRLANPSGSRPPPKARHRTPAGNTAASLHMGTARGQTQAFRWIRATPARRPRPRPGARKSVGEGKRGSVRVDLGGRGYI